MLFKLRLSILLRVIWVIKVKLKDLESKYLQRIRVSILRLKMRFKNGVGL